MRWRRRAREPAQEVSYKRKTKKAREALQEEMHPTLQKELQQTQQAQQVQQVQQVQQQQAEQLGSTQRQRKQRPVPTASGWPFSFPISHKREASQQVPDFGPPCSSLSRDSSTVAAPPRFSHRHRVPKFRACGAGPQSSVLRRPQWPRVDGAAQASGPNRLWQRGAVLTNPLTSTAKARARR